MLDEAFAEGESGVFTLTVGQCINDAAETGDVKTVPVIDCEKPHDSEVYASVTMEQAEYPGEVETVAFADEACAAQFAVFIGRAAEESIYRYATLYPTAESWAGGDREVLCRVALIDEDGAIEKVSGSLADADQ